MVIGNTRNCQIVLRLSFDQLFSVSRIIQQVNKIKGMVTRFHKDLKDVKPTPECENKYLLFLYVLLFALSLLS